ncbi:MAG: hypothetical protein JW989_01670, partial [Chlorobiaceae bacterium]|nr:hypothetical protein [Chlorobiaceae bacterium]
RIFAMRDSFLFCLFNTGLLSFRWGSETVSAGNQLNVRFLSLGTIAGCATSRHIEWARYAVCARSI